MLEEKLLTKIGEQINKFKQDWLKQKFPDKQFMDEQAWLEFYREHFQISPESLESIIENEQLTRITWISAVLGWSDAKYLKYVIYSDTDSSFFTLFDIILLLLIALQLRAGILNKLSPEQRKQLALYTRRAILQFNDEYLTKIGITRDELFELIMYLVNNYMDKAVNEILLKEFASKSTDNQEWFKLKFKQEIIGRSMYPVAGKHYLIWVLREKGKDKNEIVKQGARFKTANLPIYAKNKVEELSKLILLGESPTKIINWLRQTTKEIVDKLDKFEQDVSSAVKVNPPDTYATNYINARAGLVFESLTGSTIFSTGVTDSAFLFNILIKPEIVSTLERYYRELIQAYWSNDYSKLEKLIENFRNDKERQKLRATLKLWNVLTFLLEQMDELWYSSLSKDLKAILDFLIRKQFSLTDIPFKKFSKVLSLLDVIAIPEEGISYQEAIKLVEELFVVDTFNMIRGNMTVLYEIPYPIIKSKLPADIFRKKSTKTNVDELELLRTELLIAYFMPASHLKYLPSAILKKIKDVHSELIREQKVRQQRLRKLF